MEERTLKITLAKAKEWFNKGGELKEIALQTFSERELDNKLPTTWEEFCEMHPVEEDGEEYYIDVDSNTSYVYKGVRNPKFYKNVLPSKEIAEAYLAYMQLHQLRDCYRQGWKPNWNELTSKYCIESHYNKITIYDYVYTNRFLSFQTRELAGQFLNNFRDLIEKAKELI